ncbi:hypothetical protein Aperf_G00000032968 [Anoplocephala perfoliata]
MSVEQITTKLEEEKPKLKKPPITREALEPVRVFSFNHRIPIINLSDGENYRMFYVSGHLGVIYDVKTNEQHILRGHVNRIVSTCASRNRRWLVTGDSGPDSAVMIWDAQSRIVVRCLYRIHAEGVAALRLTADARYLATLSAQPRNGSSYQTLAIWDWTSRSSRIESDESTSELQELPQPLCYTQINTDEVGTHTQITFREDDYFQVMSNSESHVVFYDWTLEGCMTSHTPSLDANNFQTNYGKLVMSVYVPNTDMAITATSKGFVVVWTRSRWINRDAKQSPCFRAATKLVPLHHSGITYLTITSCVSSKVAIVTGDQEGKIRFFDSKFKLLHWHHDLRYGPISSISFAETGRFEQSSVFDKFGLDDLRPIDTLDPKFQFVMEDFLVATSKTIILSLQVEAKNVKLLERDQSSTVNSLATHPFRDLVTTVGHSGMVKTWNYKWLVPVRTRMLENLQLNACTFDPFGVFLAIGCTSGRVLFLDAITLDNIDQSHFDYAKGAVNKIVFSPDGNYCAFYDACYSTTLLKRAAKKQKSKWIFSGRYRSHGDRIVDILFKNFGSCSKPRLFTLSEDRMLIEYDIENAKHDVLPLMKRIQVENIAKPQCFTTMGDFYSENFICYANSESKFRLFDVDSFSIRKTTAAPISGAPFVCIAPLPEKEDFPTPPCTPTLAEKSPDKNCLVFLTDEQLGMVLVPLDGDPYKATNIIAHPSGEHGYASALAISRDRRFIFTTGGPDNSMHMWRANPGVLVAQTHLYNDPMQPFYDMLTEDEINDMKDYFYLSMLRVQGVASMDTRLISDTIPITEIPYLVRAMGLFLSESDVENMMNEVKFSQYGATGCYVNELDFDTLVKLYLNYRLPNESTSMEEIREAFEAILNFEKPHELLCPNREQCANDPPPVLQRDSLLRLLQTVGEPIRHEELVENLAVLLGLAPISGKAEDICALKNLHVSQEIEKCLPKCITCEEFCENILAMDICDKDPPALVNFRRKMQAPSTLSEEGCQTEF